uniref:Uncharacterized protein n=1 Tax=Setaria italica TaxID=4555 RepID=K3ZGK9_SETIT
MAYIICVKLWMKYRNYMTWRANELHPSRDEKMSFQTANFDCIESPHWIRADWVFRLTSVPCTYISFRSCYYVCQKGIMFEHIK